MAPIAARDAAILALLALGGTLTEAQRRRLLDAIETPRARSIADEILQTARGDCSEGAQQVLEWARGYNACGRGAEQEADDATDARARNKRDRSRE